MILLHTTKYGDSSIILHGFTREQGRKSFIIRGVGKKKGSSSTALLHPLSILETEIRPGAEYSIAQLRDYSAKYPLHSLRSSVVKNTVAIYISELLYRTLMDSERDPSLYDFLENSILTLNSLEGQFSNFHIWFTLRYISFLGFFPDLTSPQVRFIFTPDELELLSRFMTTPLEEAMKIPMRGSDRGKLIESLIRFLEQNFDRKIEIKSLRVLHEVLQ